MSPAERELLAAVVEALTVPFSASDYDRRIAGRADWVCATLKDILADGDPEWHANYLRSKLRDEEARHAGGTP